MSYIILTLLGKSYQPHFHCICFTSVYPLCQCLSRDIGYLHLYHLSIGWACPQKWMQDIQKMQYTHKWYWQYGDVSGQEVSRHVSNETMAEILQTSWQTKSASLQCVTVAMCTFGSVPFIHFYTRIYKIVTSLTCLLFCSQCTTMGPYFRANMHGTEWRETNLFFFIFQTVLWITHTI